MRLFRGWTALILLAVPVTGRTEPNMPVERWEAAYLQGVRSGHVRTLIQETEQAGATRIRSLIELRLTVKRFNDTIQLAMDSGTVETPAGAVVGTFMKQYLGKDKTLQIVGQVRGSMLELTLDGSKPLKPAPWDEQVLGIYGQRRLFKDLKPGDEFSYRSFEPTVNLVVTSHVKAVGYEEVQFPGTERKQKLLRVETRVEKIQDLQLPPQVAWLDADSEPVGSQFEVPGLGKLVLHRTTKAVALAPVSGAPGLDIGTTNFIRVNRRVNRPYDAVAARYRITVKDDAEISTIFTQDARQQVENVKDRSFELRVSESATGNNLAEPGVEFTQSSYFVNCDDNRVRQLTKLAIGSEKEAWPKCLRIEKFVKARMAIRSHESLATADHVARTLEGDCTEFAMLTAAMCRAAGVPSRTAMGLIYADQPGGPVFAFHMWTEVWVDGRWKALDATLGRGRVGATHLKIADQSWHEERSLTPLLPIVRVLGKLAIEVLEVQH